MAPSLTHRPLSSNAASLSGRTSEPRAIFTPAARALEPVAVFVHRRLGTLAQIRRQRPLLDPAFFPGVTGLTRSQVADGQGRHIPGIVLRNSAMHSSSMM